MKQSRQESDRTVHAKVPSRGGHLELVRYDRAGKWYIEGTLPEHGLRSSVSVQEAISCARKWMRRGGSHYAGLPGGQVFDRGVAR
jgi:hypothetical protein